MSEPLLDPALLPRLARLELRTRRRADGAPAGNRVGRRRGISLDFADHRAYSGGDDLRFLDWKVLARHDTPFLRRYHEEQALPVRLLLDTSASMGFGQPAKLALARAVAAGLGFVALTHGAVLSIHPFAARPGPVLGPLRGRARFAQVLRFLAGLEPAGESDLAAGAAGAALPGRSGLAIVVSDFLCPGGIAAGLARLVHARNSLFLLRLLAPEEERPELHGDLLLADAEGGGELGLSLGPSVLAAYRRALGEATDGLEAEARKLEAGILLARSDRAASDLLLVDLPREGLLG